MKKSSSLSIRNATIDINDMTITEITKDDSQTYSLVDILKEWDGVDGVTLVIKREVSIGVSVEEGGGSPD